MNSSSEENISKITLKDISNLYSDKFIDLTNIDRFIYNTITKVSIPDNIKLVGKLFDYILWQDIKQDIILISLDNSPIKSWYKIKKSSATNPRDFLIAPPVHRFTYDLTQVKSLPTVIFQGDIDEVVPSQEVAQFAQSFEQAIPLEWFLDTGHFFHGKLGELKQLLEALSSK